MQRQCVRRKSATHSKFVRGAEGLCESHHVMISHTRPSALLVQHLDTALHPTNTL